MLGLFDQAQVYLLQEVPAPWFLIISGAASAMAAVLPITPMPYAIGFCSTAAGDEMPTHGPTGPQPQNPLVLLAGGVAAAPPQVAEPRAFTANRFALLIHCPLPVAPFNHATVPGRDAMLMATQVLLLQSEQLKALALRHENVAERLSAQPLSHESVAESLSTLPLSHGSMAEQLSASAPSHESVAESWSASPLSHESVAEHLSALPLSHETVAEQFNA